MVTIPQEIKNSDGLLIWLMSYFSDKFRNHAILKGDMVLRLLKMRDDITIKAIEQELKPLLPSNELLGIDLKIRVAIEQLISHLRTKIK